MERSEDCNAPEVPLTMDRAIYRLLTYGAVGLALAYLYFHFDSIASAIRMFVNNWWH
jgi:hypothetical protein